MRNAISLSFLLFISIGSFGQKLSLTDLHTISNKSNWEYVNQYLMNKGWEYFDSEKGNSTQYHTITWSYNKSSGDKASAWFYLYTYEGFPNQVIYSVFNKPSYTIIQNALSSNGYKLSNSEIGDNEIISTYANKDFLLKITTEKRERDYDESLTGYSFLLIKKSGVYDPDNGKKTEYYYGDVRKSEYTLNNGLIEGNFTVFYPSGKVQRTGIFKSGKENGLFTEYDEEGEISAKYSMKNGLRDGLFTVYDNNKISHSTNYLNDIENGKFNEYYYTETGELFLKVHGQYLNGEKEGLWNEFLVEDGEEKRVLIYHNYDDGLKDGPFQEVNGDSLIIGNYQNDLLNGKYKVYRDLVRTFTGKVIRTNTDNLILIVDGQYSRGRKSGYWKFYDTSGALRNEGFYGNGEKQSKWKYYYTKWVNQDDESLPYSEKLFAIQSFNNGKLEGESIRYSYLNEEKYPCGEIGERGTPIDTCTKYTYQKVLETSYYRNGLLNGSYELKDSIGQIIAKGVYSNGLKEGEWFERYTQEKNDTLHKFIYYEGSYASGKMDGEWVEYYTKDHILKTFYYKQDELHGKYTEWNKNGNPRKEKIFSLGKFKNLVVYDSIGTKPEIEYDIFDVGVSSFRCIKTEYFPNGHTTQEYLINTSKEINHTVFELIFLAATDKEAGLGGTGYEDGAFNFYDGNNLPVLTGRFEKGIIVGEWTLYEYDQKVKIVSIYENKKRISEKYLTLSGSSFTGEYVHISESENTKERRKIKDGLRNGPTIYIDLTTGKTIKKESYKSGILK